MKYEYRAYYQNTRTGIAHIDEENSIPAREFTESDAAMFMKLCEEMGCARHETPTQIFYDKRMDCTHSVEHIFYK